MQAETAIPKIAGLEYYPDSRPGISRKRCGRGFTYTNTDGTRIERGPERDRITALAIPPAYASVWITPRRNGHLLATGFDARTRKQYRYHPDWSRVQALRKFDRLTDFAETLPTLRRWIADRLREGAGTQEAAIAATLALIDRASLRVGDEKYTNENGSYGATTLRPRHVEIESGGISLSYTAKGGAEVEKSLYAPRLARVLQDCADLPGAELISWETDKGDIRPVRSEHINTALKRICGDDVTAKTIRTWNGTHAAFLCACDASENLTIAAMADAAANRLHNTPTIARNSYIHPKVLDLTKCEPADRNALLDADQAADGLRKGEAALSKFLAGD